MRRWRVEYGDDDGTLHVRQNGTLTEDAGDRGSFDRVEALEKVERLLREFDATTNSVTIVRL